MIPRYLYRAVDKKYGLSKRRLCDAGCSAGENLHHAAPGSYGIEIDPGRVDHARRAGLLVYNRDLIRDNLIDLPKVDAVWCSSLLEHVDSPHILLRKLHTLLRENGLLALSVPVLPALPFLRHLPFVGYYVAGYEADDHLSAFTPRTLRFACEKAGFKTLEVSPFYPGVLSVFNKVPAARALVARCVYIGRKIDDWDYPSGASRRAAANEKGYETKIEPARAG